MIRFFFRLLQDVLAIRDLLSLFFVVCSLLLFFHLNGPILTLGMGFGQTITKVCHGKAADQSIMVVNFHGTFSGLQEAENLHKHYSENKHGRAEVQQITSQSNYSIYKSWQAVNVQSVLYGYLGIAEDLDKLEVEAKVRCFVKSKKKIQAIADAL